VIKKKRKAAQPVLQSMKNETTKATGQRIRPGEFVRANLRPRNVMAKPVKGENPFKNANQFPINERRKIALQNIEIAKSWLGSKGITATVYDGNKNIYARALGGKRVEINRNSSVWMNPSGRKRDERRSGFKSSSSPVHTLWHEMGHEKDKRLPFRWQEAVNYSMTNAGRKRRYKSFVTAANPTLSKAARKRRGKEIEALARRVSSYATTNPSEFAAETYAGRRTGRKYDYQVMSAYRETKGLNPNPIVRKLKKKGKTKPNP
jgi:cytochrome c1